MNYVDDIAVTFRRMLLVIPTLSEEEKARITEYIQNAQPSYTTVLDALK